MSPKPSKPGASKKLTVEFSGICTLIYNRKAATANVQMVDLASAGFDRHYVAMGMVVSAATARGVKGPDADAAVSLPGSDTDVGIWSLGGSDVEFVGGTGKLVVDDNLVDVTKKPGKNATSVRWLANIGYLADSSAHSAICPTAAAVTLASGTLTAKNVGNPQKLQFVDPTGLIGPARYCLSRFQVVIPFESELGVRLDRRRVLRFTETNSVVMSNTCVCDLGINQPPDHFLAHYEVVQAKRRPTIKPAKPAGPGAKVPWWPDLCLVGYVEI